MVKERKEREKEKKRKEKREMIEREQARERGKGGRKTQTPTYPHKERYKENTPYSTSKIPPHSDRNKKTGRKNGLFSLGLFSGFLENNSPSPCLERRKKTPELNISNRMKNLRLFFKKLKKMPSKEKFKLRKRPIWSNGEILPPPQLFFGKDLFFSPPKSRVNPEK
jgi:hypothetical protein